MSAEEAPQSEKKLSKDEVIALKARLRGEDDMPNLLAMQVCRQLAEDLADEIEQQTGRRPGHQEEWKFANSITRGMALQSALALPADEWPESLSFPRPEAYAAALAVIEESQDNG